MLPLLIWLKLGSKFSAKQTNITEKFKIVQSRKIDWDIYRGSLIFSAHKRSQCLLTYSIFEGLQSWIKVSIDTFYFYATATAGPPWWWIQNFAPTHLRRCSHTVCSRQSRLLRLNVVTQTKGGPYIWSICIDCTLLTKDNKSPLNQTSRPLHFTLTTC